MKRDLKFQNYIDAIKKYYNKNKHIPSFDIALNIFSLKSKASIHKIFKKMINLHYLQKDGSKFSPGEKLLSISVYESIKAGFPSPAYEENKFDINIQEYLIKKPNSTILLKVKGDSMIDEGIKEGDLVIVDKSLVAKEGDIIIAIVDENYTMKFLIKEKNKFILRSANKKYKDIHPDKELQIFGVVTGIIRKIKNH